MNISVFCASSHPRTPRFAEAAAALGRAIARGGHTLLYGGSNLGLMGIAPAYSLHPAPVRGETDRMKHPFARARAMRACSHCRAAEWCAKQTK